MKWVYLLAFFTEIIGKFISVSVFKASDSFTALLRCYCDHHLRDNYFIFCH